MAPALELVDVTKRFGDKVAVDRVSLTLEAGAFLGLLGRNGAGKSTTLKMLTGPQYLRFVGRMYGLADDVIDARTEELFAKLDLAPGPRLLVADYSFGMKKKIAFSAAMMHGPRVVFLDEPFEGIDPVTSRTIKDILVASRARGVTLVLTSHILEIVERLCPLVAVL